MLVGCLSLYFGSGCSPDPQLVPRDPYFITRADAESFVFAIAANGQGDELKSRDGVVIDNLTAITIGSNTPSAYLFNITYSGTPAWALVSADTRLRPLLAYGKGDHLAPTSLQLGGVEECVGRADAWVDQYRASGDSDIGVHDIEQIKKVLCLEPAGCPNDGGPGTGGLNTCTPWDYVWGPLMSTNWSQNCPYNDRITIGACSDFCGLTHPPIGCVATAGAQIARYHLRPAAFSYNLMLNRYDWWDATHRATAWSAGNVADLSFNVAQGVQMDFSCNGSGARTERLSNYFGSAGYSSSGKYRDWSPLTIETDVRRSLPVVVSGSDSDEGGHAWVADGYRSMRIEGPLCTNLGWTHMDWGWNGRSNGWYSVDVWAPVNDPVLNFNRSNKILHNIRP